MCLRTLFLIMSWLSLPLVSFWASAAAEHTVFTLSDLRSSSAQFSKSANSTVIKMEVEGLSAPLEVELVPFEVFALESQTLVYGEGGVKKLPRPTTRYYRGRISGESDSAVFLGIRADGSLIGILRDRDVLRIIQDTLLLQPGRPLMAHQVEPQQDFAGRGFQCGNEFLAQSVDKQFERFVWGERTSRETIPSQLATQNYVATVAVETDYEFYQLFGNTTTAQQYIADLFAYVSSLYQSEIDTRLQLGDIHLRTTASDPWTQDTTTCGLLEFGGYWHNNYSTVSRSTAHFLSGKLLGGGIAWVGVLCEGDFQYDAGCSGLSRSTSYGGGYGFSADISGGFDVNNPGVVWDAFVVAHEIGHNFDSPHSHCYNGIGSNSNPIDGCYNAEQGCYSGTAMLPGVGSLSGGSAGQGDGTIMSYCHTLDGGMSNISMTFGDSHIYGIEASRESSHMGSYVASTASSNPSCIITNTTSTSNTTLPLSVLSILLLN